HIVSDRRLQQSAPCPVKPFLEISAEPDSSFGIQGHNSPRADWQNPKFILRIPDLGPGTFSEPRYVRNQPEPNMRIEQQFQSRRTSQSSSSVAGEIMSPRSEENT